MSEPGNGAGVQYSVKELLAKIEGKIDGVIITIGQKADSHDVDLIERRVALLEQDRQGNLALRDFARWLAPLLVLLGATFLAHYLH